MRKIVSVLLIICLLVISFLPIGLFVEEVEATGEHDVESEMVIGEIETDNVPTNISIVVGKPVGGDISYTLSPVFFSPDSTEMAFACDDGRVLVYYTSNLTCLANISGLGTPTVISFSSDGNYLAVSFDESIGFVHVYYTSNWTLKVNLTDATDSTWDMKFSPDNQWLAVSSDDEWIYIYYVSNFTLKTKWNISDEVSLYTLSFSPDSEYLVYGEFVSTYVRVYYTSNWSLKQSILEWSLKPYSTEFSPNNEWLVISSLNSSAPHAINIFNATTFSLLQRIVVDGYGLVRFSSDNKWLFWGSSNDEIQIFNTTSWEKTKIMSTNEKACTLDIADNNQYLGYSQNQAYKIGSQWYQTTYVIFRSIFNVTRNCSASPEYETFNFTTQRSYTDDVTFKIPVSSSVRGIESVTNNTANINALEVDSPAELVNNSFWYDNTNQLVYIRTINLTIGTIVDWTVNCSYGATFNIVMPRYLEVGDYLIASGLILNSTDEPIDGFIATTRILYQNGSDAIDPPHKWNCVNGNYYCIISTNLLLPGVYSVSIEFTDSDSGVTYKEGDTLYLSVDPGSGIHIATKLCFSFYNNNTGIGLDSKSFKIYASTDTTISSTDRIYRDTYDTYTGATIYYRIDDYFDNQIYPLTGNYQMLNITSINQFEDVPINWYSFSVKNMNHSIVKFLMINGSRTYTQYLFPYEPFYWNILPGEYTINLTYYNAVTDVIEFYSEENITLSTNGYYWIRGYDLRDIIIQITATNTTISDLILDVQIDVDVINSTVGTMIVDIQTSLSLTESNITTLVNNIWNSMNITDSIVDYLNATLWSNFTAISNDIGSLNLSFVNSVSLAENNITTLQLNLWADVNNSLKNRSLIMLNFYNTNDGLGLPGEVFKAYVNGERLTGKTFWCMNNTEINITIKDYYNFTLRSDIFNVTAPYTFLDLGLTFHSWLFGNKNEKYYMISFLKSGASRWYERGIVPNGGEREFILPSGAYTMRIYDADWNELHNSSYTVNRSMVYVIEGCNLSVVIAGMSVITGQLLELNDEISYALMPDAIIWSYNPMIIFSVFDRVGQMLGNSVWKVCPALNVIATTKTSTYGNWINSTALIPSNGTTANGTIRVMEDIMYFSGSGITWVNITYTDNLTLYQNTSYMPSKLDFEGENLTINASGNINIRRETTYSQLLKFSWNIHNSTLNPGPIPGRAGYHSAGITVSNPFSVPLYDVYVYAGFSEVTKPDYSSIIVTDVDNDIVVETGENFKTGGSGIEFKVYGGLSANEEREFLLEYYKDLSYTYYYEDAQYVLRHYDEKKTLSGHDELFNRAEFMWINDEPLGFRGSLRVKFAFDIDVDEDSVAVFDLDNNVEIDEDELIITNEFVWISSSVIGDVQAGGTRSFAIYFIELTYPGYDVSVYHLSTPYLYIGAFPVSVFTIVVLICLVLSGTGLILLINNVLIRKRKYKDSYLLLIGVGLAMSFVFWLLQAKGV